MRRFQTLFSTSSVNMLLHMGEGCAQHLADPEVHTPTAPERKNDARNYIDKTLGSQIAGGRPDDP